MHAALLSLVLATGIAWQPYSEDVFARADAQNKFVLFDLEALWCHWCHVMDAKTYHDPRVVELINEHYIPVRVDQDADPDLSRRYEDYGWPATIVFAADGSEIVKRRGYIPPVGMISLLEAIIEDPSPGPSVFAAPTVVPDDDGRLTDAQRAHILANFHAVYDPEHGGWGNVHKFLHADTAEYALVRAADGGRAYELMLRQTLHANRALFDEKEGGVYQYSDRLDWKGPHFEKIMSSQTDNLRLYSLAYSQLEREAYKTAAAEVVRFLFERMRSPSGAFYTSQDADTKKIDRTLYARENAWVARALVVYHEATGDKAALDAAVKAARWVVKNRRARDGVFRHGEKPGGPFLDDQLAMAEAAWALHRATGKKKWRTVANETMDIVEKRFAHNSGAGFVTAPTPAHAVGVLAEPARNVEQNIRIARLAVKMERRETAKSAMRYLCAEPVASQRRYLAGLLLADREMDAPVARNR